MKTILFLMSGYSQAEKRGRDEILRFARTRKWRVQCIPYAQAEASRYSLVNSFAVRDIDGLIAFWKPDGCIAECGAAPTSLQPSDFRGTPVVFLDRDPATLSSPALCVASDNRRIAISAFDELKRTGRRSFAFAGWYTHASWSEERRREFSAILEAEGFEMHLLDMRFPHRDARMSNTKLLKSIRSLPRPAAVFAANDIVAEHVASVCVQNGISVPGDIAIIGVDNAEDICENSIVTITSIPQDYAVSGRTACEMLEHAMSHPQAAPETRYIGVEAVVRRASTRAAGLDSRIRAALEYIRLHAPLGIGVDDVVKSMGCSRRTADMLFRKSLGRSILNEIIKAKVERVKAMLADDGTTVSLISDMCGFTSTNELDRVFRRVTGMSPRAWREGRRRRHCENSCKIVS